MPDDFTPEEHDILANSPADAPVIVGDGDADDGEASADEEVIGTAGGPTTAPDATQAGS